MRERKEREKERERERGGELRETKKYTGRMEKENKLDIKIV